MTKASKIIYLFVSIIFFICFSAYLSFYIMSNGYKLGENPIFSITFIQNQGAAFNIFQGYKEFLIAFSVLAFIGIICYAVKQIKQISVMGLFFISLLSAGIFNNMAERVFLGYVRDFIKLNFINFPVFNLSDILINIGVLGIVVIILKNNYIKK